MTIPTSPDMITSLRSLNIAKCSKLCSRIIGSCNNFCQYTINDQSKVTCYSCMLLKVIGFFNVCALNIHCTVFIYIFSIGFRNLVENCDAPCWSKSTEQLYSNDHLIATAKVMHQKQKLFKQLSIWLSVHKLLQMHDFRRTQQISSRSILAQYSKYYRNCWNYYQASFKNWLSLHVDITKYILIVDNRTWKFAVI